MFEGEAASTIKHACKCGTNRKLDKPSPATQLPKQTEFTNVIGKFPSGFCHAMSESPFKFSHVMTNFPSVFAWANQDREMIV